MKFDATQDVYEPGTPIDRCYGDPKDGPGRALWQKRVVKMLDLFCSHSAPEGPWHSVARCAKCADMFDTLMYVIPDAEDLAFRAGYMRAMAVKERVYGKK